MKKIVIIYWSGTGNTEAMAKSVAKGARSSDVQVNLINVSDATTDDVIGADAVALGCPSMGSEILEEAEMEPFVESLNDKVINKPMVLFGSFGWGEGEWMTDWEVRMKEYGANLLAEGLTINETPDDEGHKKCEKLGNIIIKALL